MLVVHFAVNDLLTVSPRGNLPYGFQGRASGMGREREVIERDCVTEAGITTRTTSGGPLSDHRAGRCRRSSDPPG